MLFVSSICVKRRRISIIYSYFSVPKFDLVAEGLTSLSHRILDHPTVELIRSRLVESRQSKENRPSHSSAAPAPSFDDLSRFSSVIGDVSLMTNQLVLRFEAASDDLATEATASGTSIDSRGKKPTRTQSQSLRVFKPPAQLTLSCSEFSANLNIPRPNNSSSSPAASSSSSAFECLLSFYDLNSSLECLGTRHQFFGPFHAQISCVLSDQLQVALTVSCVWGGVEEEEGGGERCF